jgi:hypothetical protein
VVIFTGFGQPLSLFLAWFGAGPMVVQLTDPIGPVIRCHDSVGIFVYILIFGLTVYVRYLQLSGPGIQFFGFGRDLILGYYRERLGVARG